MKVAIFADIHGKVLLPFVLVDMYQKHTGQRIDCILQCGDMGAYPNLSTLDKATIKHAKRDRDELGFYDGFVTEHPDIKAFLDRLNLNMICVRGNHEDHAFLDQLEAKAVGSMFAIDAYQRVLVCKTGLKQELHFGDQTLSFVGVGRIGDRKLRTEPKHIQPYEQQRIKMLYSSHHTFDVLLSHDRDQDSQRGYGMPDIKELLNNTLFRYHFYGHTGESFRQELSFNGLTQSVKIKELEFGDSGILDAGCMVVLSKHDGVLELQVVSQSLTNLVTKHNWKSLIKSDA